MPDRFVYLALLLGWALPVIALHWLIGAAELRARWRLLVVAIVMPSLYLAIADSVAIGTGVWSISEELTIGWRVGGLVFEEVVFFLLTNILVAQSVILFLAPSARQRAARLVRRSISFADRRSDTAADEQHSASNVPER